MKKIQYKIILCLLGFLMLPITGHQIAHAEKRHDGENYKKVERKSNEDFISRFPMLSALLVQDQTDIGDQSGDPITPQPVAPPTPEPTKIATVTSDTQQPKPIVQQKDVGNKVAIAPTTRAVSISEIPKLFVTRTSSNTLYEQNKLNPTATKLFIILSSMLAIGGLVMVTGQPQTIAYRISSFFSFL